MTATSSLSRVAGPADPVAALDYATKQYIDAQIAAVNLASGAVPSDRINYADQFASTERRIATSQDTLSTGFHSFSGGPVPQAIVAATKLRFAVRAVVPVGGVVTFALHRGSARNNLPKIGSDIVVTANFSAIGLKELTIPSFSAAVGEFVYLSMLRTGSGTPDPAMATTGAANGDLFNPNSSTFVTGYKSGQSSIPSTLDTSAAFTGSGRIFWFALA